MSKSSKGWTITHNINQETGQYSTYTLTCTDFTSRTKSISLQCGGLVMTGDVNISISAKEGNGNLNISLWEDNIASYTANQYKKDDKYWYNLYESYTFENMKVQNFTKGWFESAPTGTFNITMGAKVPKITASVGTTWLGDQLAVVDGKTGGYVQITEGYIKTGAYVQVNACSTSTLNAWAKLGGSYDTYYPTYGTLLSQVTVRQISPENNISGYDDTSVTYGSTKINRYQFAIMLHDKTTFKYGSSSASTTFSNSLQGGAVVFNNGSDWYVKEHTDSDNQGTKIINGTDPIYIWTSGSDKSFRIMQGYLKVYTG